MICLKPWVIACNTCYFRSVSLEADPVMLARSACVCWFNCGFVVLFNQLYALKIYVFWDVTLSLEEGSCWTA
jgi:hypothetical protein